MPSNSIVFVTNEKDQLSSRVLDWLNYYDHPFFRLNTDTISSNLNFKLSDDAIMLFIELEEESFCFDIEANSFFFHHASLPFKPPFNGTYFQNEANNLRFSIAQMIFDQNNIGALPEEQNFKLYNLFIAREVGLKIPSTLIGSKPFLENQTINNENKYISKSITNVFKLFFNDGVLLGPGTVELNKDSFQREKIASSLVQKKIEKQFEIRTVLFDGDFYSLAIFSNNATDYRNLYIDSKPRNIPFKLPEEIEEKLLKVALKLKLQFCSFDLIYSDKREYIFIEVNPEGVIDWVSFYGNFGIEEKIAKKIMDEKRRA